MPERLTQPVALQMLNAGAATPARAARAPGQTSSHVARVHAGASNQSLQRALRARVLQAKLTINQPGDNYEQEADRVAGTVMRMPDPNARSAPEITPLSQSPLQRCSCGALSSSGQCDDCASKDRDLQRTAVGPATAETAPSLVDQVLQGSGQPLDKSTRAFMESRFGQNFADVRIHTGPRAGDSARAVNALAYTVGKNVVFATGQYSPQTDAGRRLLAHELTHTLQQGGGTQANRSQSVQRQPAPGAVPSVSAQLLSGGAARGLERSSGSRTMSRHFIGNQSMQRASRAGWRQTNLTIRKPGDLYEQQADYVSNAVMRTPEPGETQSSVTSESQISAAALSLQRMGDPKQAPAMACLIPTSPSSRPADFDILFGSGADDLTSEAMADIDTFAGRWNAAGADRPVRVDGFASTDGGQVLNWTISCQRAQAVAKRLQNPGSGRGVASSFLEVYAQGETSEFSTTMELNRRATIKSDLSKPIPSSCDYPGLLRELELRPVFLRTGPEDHSPTGASWKRRFKAANDIWGKLGVSFRERAPVTIETPLKTSPLVPDYYVPAVAGLYSGPGVEVFLIENDLPKHGGGATLPGCSSTGKVVLSDLGSSDTLLAHELGHTMGLNHPGASNNPGDPNTIMEASNSNSVSNPSRNTIGNYNGIHCPPGSGDICLHLDT